MVVFQMYMPNLLLDVPCRGSVLVVRTFAHPFDVSSMQLCAAIEDEAGNLDQLSIYHYNYARWPVKQLRSGTVLAIKEPYYRSVVTNGGVTLSVFHPSDVVFLEQDHPLFPEKWKTAEGRVVKPAMQWKSEGNEALKKKDYHKANHCYEKGLAAADLDNTLACDIHRNKALVDTYLGRFETAKADALASLLNKPDDKSKELDTKALYRAGRAAYELSSYQEAHDLFRKLLQLSPSDNDGQREAKRTADRLKEEQEGVFDFTAMSKRITSTSDFRAEQASYLCRTEVRQTQDKGRGLFATQSIACGDIVLCEKALVAGDTPRGSGLQNFVMSPSSRHVFWGGHAETWFVAVQNISNNASLARRMFNLYADSTPSKKGSPSETLTEVPIVDGVPVIDVFRVMDILETNAFGFMARQDRSKPYPNIPQPELEGFYDSLGLWERASYANHSCLPNTSRSFLGDFMLVRATKDIPKDAEITMSYISIDGKHEHTKMYLAGWGFRCDCALCAAETKYDGTRSHLIPGADSFEAAEPPIDLHALCPRRPPRQPSLPLRRKTGANLPVHHLLKPASHGFGQTPRLAPKSPPRQTRGFRLRWARRPRPRLCAKAKRKRGL